MAKTETVLNVKGMSCSHCAAAVKNAVGALPGVYNVNVDLASGRVTVSHDPEEAISATQSKTGATTRTDGCFARAGTACGEPPRAQPVSPRRFARRKWNSLFWRESLRHLPPIFIS